MLRLTVVAGVALCVWGAASPSYAQHGSATVGDFRLASTAMIERAMRERGWVEPSAQEQPLASEAASDWHVSRFTYIAVGSGGLGTGVFSSGYSADGLDVRGVQDNGHGAFLRFEEGDTQWLHAGPDTDRYVLAVDMGYAFGGPLAGGWDDGLLGFLELGMTTWHTRGYAISRARGVQYLENGNPLTENGLGFALGAAVETSAWDGVRLGVAIQRRDVPFFLDGPGASASSTTVSLRIGGAI